MGYALAFIFGMAVAYLPLAARWYWRRERRVQQEITYGNPPEPVAPQQIEPVHPAGNPVMSRVSFRNLPGRRRVRGNRTNF